MYTPKCPMCYSAHVIVDKQLEINIVDNPYSRLLKRHVEGHCAKCSTTFQWVESYVLDSITQLTCEALGKKQLEEAEALLEE